jgi:hypothetical protein
MGLGFAPASSHGSSLLLKKGTEHSTVQSFRCRLDSSGIIGHLSYGLAPLPTLAIFLSSFYPAPFLEISDSKDFLAPYLSGQFG